jgi:hypothetical protein
VLLSILVPTLAARQRLFERIFGELETQIDKSGLRGEVEILTLADQGEMPIGEKRNLLVARSRGEFIAFVDDDDMVSEDYLRSIVEVLRRRPDVDCVGIRVLMFFRGRHPRHVAHSVRYTELGRHGVEYRRPPYILNPIRRSIAQRYPFSNLRYQEDLEWAMRMSRMARYATKSLSTSRFITITREGGSRCSGCWIRAKRSVTVSDYG